MINLEFKETLLTTKNEELDLRLGGGIPIPNLLIIEGPHGSGKTVLVQQIIYGAIKSNKRVLFITTESGVREIIIQSRRISLDIMREFIRGQLQIIPLHIAGVHWSQEEANRFIDIIKDYMMFTKDYYDVLAIDSLSVIAYGADRYSVLEFLSKARIITRESKLIVLTIHPKMLPEEIMTSLKAICDSYFKLGFAEVGGRLIKVLRVIKLRGTSGVAESSIAFDIDPAFGIKVVPLALAKA